MRYRKEFIGHSFILIQAFSQIYVGYDDGKCCMKCGLSLKMNDQAEEQSYTTTNNTIKWVRGKKPSLMQAQELYRNATVWEGKRGKINFCLI